MIKILEVNPNSNDAMSLYRGRGPLIHLQKTYKGEIEFHPSSRPGEVHTEWDYIKIFDAVFIMRPTHEHHANVVKACNTYGIPVWVDFDDLLTDIPINNPAHVGYMNTKKNKFMDEILDGCTFATFSTEYLRQKMGHKILHKSHVVPNALDLSIFKKPSLIGSKKKILWRGGSTHERDIEQFERPIREVIRGFQQNKNGWIAEFMGLNPIHVTDYVDAIYTPYMSKNSYFDYLNKVNGKINIVPLSHRQEEIDFNKSKSNIAWLETLYAGFITLAPDWDEWRKPGIINYKSSPDLEEVRKDFGNKLTAMMNGEYDLESLRQQSWQYVHKYLTLDVTNRIRYKLINLYLKEQSGMETA